jgi:hypothetical protein
LEDTATDRLEYFFWFGTGELGDFCCRSTRVEIIDDDDEPVDVGGIDQLSEFIPEGMNVLRQIIALAWCLLNEVARFFSDALQILFRNVILRLSKERRGEVIQAFT